MGHNQWMNEAGVTGELVALRERVAELEAAEAQRRRAEQVQEALYRIAETASAARDMHEFYAAMHQIVGELMDARNFFITLYDEERQMINWPYYVDEVDLDVPDPDAWDPIGTGEARGLTAYVLRTGEPLLATPAVYRNLLERGEVEDVGEAGVDWLGVPLTSEGGRSASSSCRATPRTSATRRRTRSC